MCILDANFKMRTQTSKLGMDFGVDPLANSMTYMGRFSADSASKSYEYCMIYGL